MTAARLSITLFGEEIRAEWWRVVQVRGQPVEENLEPLRAALARELHTDRCKICVRFEDPGRMDAGVLEVLGRAMREARRAGGEVHIEPEDELTEIIMRFLRRGGSHEGGAGVPARLPKPPEPRSGQRAKDLEDTQ